ncbi:MAG: hypothetical protein AAF366_15810 [Pseudomonadota bacterium]
MTDRIVHMTHNLAAEDLARSQALWRILVDYPFEVAATADALEERAKDPDRVRELAKRLRATAINANQLSGELRALFEGVQLHENMEGIIQ